LAREAVNNLNGESRERTYDAFLPPVLMAKAGEIKVVDARNEEHQNTEVRLAVVKLLALSGQPEDRSCISPACRTRVITIGGAICGDGSDLSISSQARETAPSVA